MIKEFKSNNKMGIIGYIDNWELCGSARILVSFLNDYLKLING